MISPDEVTPYTESRENRFVFRQDFLRNQPDESSMLKPIYEEMTHSDAPRYAGLNPATPATSTDVSITPLGCFSRRPNRYLRQFLLLGTEAANCVRNLGFCHARTIHSPPPLNCA